MLEYLPPYFHPTSTLFVDDDRNFLAHLSLELGADLPHRLFDSPQRVLDFMRNQEDTGLGPRYLAECLDTSGRGDHEQAIHAGLKDLLQEIGNVGRFEQVSVVVVDYDMPEMDGLSLCRALTDFRVKKILLTGVADERQAVTAFNQGIIDGYINKSDPETVAALRTAIRDLQRRYFRDISRGLADLLSMTSASLLRDQEFSGEFERIFRTGGFTEYYLLPNQDGFLLLDDASNQHLLVVLSEEQMAVHEEIARDEGAPSALLRQLGDRSHVPWFDTSDGFYRADQTLDAMCCFPAKELGATHRYYYALVDRGLAGSEGQPRARGFKAFLHEIGKQGFTDW